ncbi:MAG: hypothetical protein WCR55_14565 [Lentisphaerota bacterium]
MYSNLFQVIKDKALLDGTAYIEIGAGRYKGKHFQDSFIFLDEDGFFFAEGLLYKYVKNYDHYEMNNIHKSIGLSYAHELSDIAREFLSISAIEITKRLNLKPTFESWLAKKLEEHRKEIKEMLSEVSIFILDCYRKNDWICVLGL